MSWFRESFHPSLFVFFYLLYKNISIDYLVYPIQILHYNIWNLFHGYFFFFTQNTGHIINRTVVWGTNSYAQVRGCTRMCELSCKHGDQEGGEEGIYSFTNDGRMYAG